MPSGTAAAVDETTLFGFALYREAELNAQKSVPL